jgi:hypothetical protein
MKPFRFSPIKNKTELLKAIEYIHLGAHKMCKQNLGYLLPVAGNIGVFCHYPEEFEQLTEIRKVMTDIDDNWNQKYFRLHEPIVIPAQNEIPETTYRYLYVRKPDEKSPNVGDADFYLEPIKYKELKQKVISGKFETGLRIFERTDLDMIRLFDPVIDVSAFITSYNLEEVTTHRH